MNLKPHPKFGICLDAGSGIGPKRPAIGFSAYCDIIQPKNGDVVPENYHVAALEDMWCFTDKQFDYVRCHHAIEHTFDPDKACSELIRVGRRGLISYPPMWSCMLFGRRDHNWFVTEDTGRLVFIRKRHPSYGVPRRDVGTKLNLNFSWEGDFKWLVVN
jgi:SAM-dependent methyltransferase